MTYDPNKFKQAAPAIATYQATDIINGQGITVFYGQIQATNAGDSFNLVLNTNPSRGVVADRWINQTNSPYNFDSQPFHAPRTISGVAHFIAEAHETTGSHVALTVSVNHVRGVNVTNIGTATTSTSTANAYIFQMPITLTKKHFAEGDILRIIVTHPTAAFTDVACDPSGKYESMNPMEFHIPFDIDL